MNIENTQIPNKSPDQTKIELEIIPEIFELFKHLEVTNPKTQEEMLDFDDKLIHLDGLLETVFQFQNKIHIKDIELAKADKGYKIQENLYYYTKVEKDLHQQGLLTPHETINEKIDNLHLKIIDLEINR